jgi:tripartite ATP-independent transporter DctP family solute receptor
MLSNQLKTARIVWMAGLLFLSACAGDGSQSGLLELKIGTVNAPGSLVSNTAEEFVERVNKRLAGRVQVTSFGSSQLGTDEVMLQKLKLGTLDFSVPSTIMSSVVDEFGLFDVPYLIEDRDHMRRVGEEVFWPKIAPLVEAKGYKILGLWENGFRHITNNTRAIQGPEDLRGVKLRTPQGAWRVRLFQVFGANPTPMPLSEVFVALQTGVIDGQENPLVQVSSLRLHEVQQYLSLTNHLYSPCYLVTGLNRWNSLPEDIREEIERTAREIQEFAYAEAERMDSEILEFLRTTGIRINQADRARFLEASRPIYDEFGSAVAGGGEMIEAVIALSSGKP